MRTFKKTLAMVLSACLLLGCFPLIAGAIPEPSLTGNCGDNLTYSLAMGTGELTISGTGAFTPWPSVFDVPWNQERGTITSVTLNEGMTDIGNYAFQDCTKVTSINIPSTVTNIGKSSFQGCTGLTEILIPGNVLTIGESAFRSCTNISDITIEEGVTSIGNVAFHSCAITSITLPSSLTQLGGAAFGSCFALSTATLNNPTNIEIMDSQAFSVSTTIRAYCTVESAATDGYFTPFEWAMEYDNPFVSLGHAGEWTTTVEPTTTTTGTKTRTCSICGETETEVIPALTGGTNWSFNATNNWLVIGGTGDMPDWTQSDSKPWDGYANDITSIIINNGVTGIGKYAFYNLPHLSSFTISSSVTSIGDFAFANCDNLTTCTIPNGVTNIGVGAFKNCTSLTKASISNTVEYIDSSAFNNCASLVSVNLPRNTSYTSIRSDVFANCSFLKSITIPANVTEIYDSAFYNSGIISVTMKGQDTTISYGAFNENSSNDNLSSFSIRYDADISEFYNVVNTELPYVTDIYFDNPTTVNLNAISPETLPENVKIHAYCATGSSDTTGYLTPYDLVTYYGDSCGYTFESLEHVGEWTTTVEPTTTTTGSRTRTCTFCGETETEENVEMPVISETLEDGLTWTFNPTTGVFTISGTGAISDWTLYSIKPWNDYENSITSVVLNNGITAIGNYSFKQLANLTSVTIPTSVTRIGLGAFQECTKLTTVTVPASVTSIDTSAFVACENLTDVYIANSTNVELGQRKTWVYPAAFPQTTTIHAYCTVEPAITENYLNPYDHTQNNGNPFVSLGHVNSEWTTTVEPTATTTGTKTRTCSVCGEVETETIPVLNVTNYSGICGDDLTWTLDTVTGILEISGSGDMYSYGVGPAVAPWYNYRKTITRIIIPFELTTIGDYAFNGCSNVTSITLPENVIAVGGSAFEGCSGLANVYINNASSVKISTNSAAFPVMTTIRAYCTVETSATEHYLNPYDYATERGNNFISRGHDAGEWVTTIEPTTVYTGTEARKCTVCGTILEYATLPVLTVLSGTCGDNATWSLDLETGILTIGGTGNMTDWTESIRAPWYDYRDYVTGVVINSGITSIGIFAIYNCPNVISVSIPDTVTNIKRNSFGFCASLESITIPDSVLTIGNEAFKKCSALTSITLSENTTSIGNYAFGYCSNLTSITIPAGVDTIPINTFYDSAISTLIFEGANTIIDIDAVNANENNNYLETFNLVYDTEVEVIDEFVAFSIYEDNGEICPVTDIYFNNPLVNIGNTLSENPTGGPFADTFAIAPTIHAYCTELSGDERSPAQVAQDYGYQFESLGHNPGAWITTVPPTTTTTGVKTKTCTVCNATVETDTIPVLEVYSGTCGDNLTWTFNPDTGVLEISGTGDMYSYGVDPAVAPWYDYKEAITNVVLNEGMTNIGCEAFINCNRFSTINIPSTVTEIGDSAFFNTGITEITIPGNVLNIGKNAFTLSGVSNITISEGVKTISNNAFHSCPLTSITIPESVVDIGEGAFDNCTLLEDVYINNASNIEIADLFTFSDRATIHAYCTVETSTTQHYLNPYDYAQSNFNPFVSLGHVDGEWTTTVEPTTTTTGTKTRTCPVCGETETEVIPVIQSISANNLNINFGETETISVVSLPYNLPYTNVSYHSSDDSIVSVNASGVVTGVNGGTAVITITDKNVSTVQTTITVTVFKPVTGIHATNESMELVIGEIGVIGAHTIPEDATNTALIFTSNDTSIVQVDGDLVTAIGKGTTTITITSVSNPSVTKTINVTVIKPVMSITVTNESLAFVLGVTSPINIGAVANPADASDTSLSYVSNNTSVVTVNNGIVTAVGKGTTTITVSSVSNPAITKTISVTVTKPVTGITVANENLAFILGVTAPINIGASVNPTDASNTALSYVSNNTNVATVNNGIVTAVGKGTTTIIITSTGNPEITKTVTVTVTKPVTSITASNTSLAFVLGVTEPINIGAVANPADASNTALSYVSNNTNVATVNNGIVTAVGKGTTTITVSSVSNPEITKTINVTVTKPVTGITVANESLAFILGVTEPTNIGAVANPADASNTALSYVSNDTDVVTVNNGIVTAVGKGTTTIMVSSVSNPEITKTINVTVTKPVTSITAYDIALCRGVSQSINAIANPTDASNTSLEYFSNNSDIVSVDNSGVITANRIGTTTITITSVSNPEVTKTINITVAASAISANNITLNVGNDKTINVISLPDNTPYTNVSYESSDDDIATVVNGVVTGVSKGTAIITITDSDVPTVQTTITVTVLKPVTSITASSTNLAFVLGVTEPIDIGAVANPADASNTALSYVSNNTNIATVEDGIVTAVGKGSTTITIASVSNPSITKIINITVMKPVTSITASNTNLAFVLGVTEPINIGAVANPADASNTALSYVSNNTNVATVNNGIVTAVGKGTTTITVSSVSNPEITKTINVTVTKPVTSITASNTNLAFVLGVTEPIDIGAVATPTDASNTALSYVSSDTDVATVNNGIVTAVGKGTTTITVSSVSNPEITKTINVTVTKPVASITASNTNLAFVLGVTEPIDIGAIANPADASDTSLSYVSNNTSVATVNNGIVTAVGKGTTTITVSSVSNPEITKTISVTVTKPVTNITVTNESLAFILGVTEPTDIGAVANPTDASNTALNYVSNDTDVVTVENGVVTAVGKGTTTITITSVSNPEVTKIINVTVTKPVTDITITSESLAFVLGVTEPIDIGAVATPTDASNTALSYVSSDTDVATVNNGIVTAVGKGSTTITVSSVSNPEIVKTINVTVTKPVTSITASNTNLIFVLGVTEPIDIGAIANPTDASDVRLSYVSNDTDVATVNNGIVTAIGKGTATITVTSTSNPEITKTISVTVTKPVTNIQASDISLRVGTSTAIGAFVIPADASNTSLVYTSNNIDIVSVDSSGIITANEIGTTTIQIASISNPEVTKTINVTVTASGISANDITLNVGDNKIINVVSLPENTPYTNVSYESSDNTIVDVDIYGNITGINKGNATITITDKNIPEIFTTITVTVLKPVTSITAANESLAFVLGITEPINIGAIANPTDASNTALSYVSSDTDVATVNNGIVTATGKGTATITITSVSNPSIAKIINVTVTKPVTSITVNDDDVAFILGVTEPINIGAVANPTDASDVNLSYVSNDTDVATVENGIITAVGKGTTTITVSSVSNPEIIKTISITVTKPVTNITVTNESLAFVLGVTEPIDIGAVANPTDASNTALNYVSNDTDVATVENGVITAVGKGTTTITVSSVSNPEIIKTISITVTKPVTNITVANESLAFVLDVTEPINIGAVANPTDASNISLSYVSNDTNIATVENGIVTAVGKGTTTITVTSISNPEVTKFINVTVTKPVADITITNESLEFVLGVTSPIDIGAVAAPTDASNTALNYVSNDTDVATVEDGVVTAIGKGTATITVSSVSNPEIVKTISVTVTKPVTGITVADESLAFVLGVTEPIDIGAVANPTDASNTALSYVSNDTDVATVNNGIVTAVGKGTTTITVSSVSNPEITKTINITVTKPVTGITVANESLAFILGATEPTNIGAVANPTDASDVRLGYVSNNTDVVTVNNGIVTAVGKGTTTITITSVSNPEITKTISVTVTKPVTSITASNTNLVFVLGITEPIDIDAVANPTDASDTSLSYVSNDTDVATVNNGIVTAVGKGTTTITITSVSSPEVTKIINVTVTKPVTDITITNESLAFILGVTEPIDIGAVATPTDASNTALSYVSSDTDVATVNNGIVTAVGKGTTTITVSSVSNPEITKTISVTVMKPVTDITITNESLAFVLGVTEPTDIGAVANPTDASNTALNYVSGDTSVATVEDGIVTAVGKGTTTITVSSVSNPEITKIISITVTKPVTSITASENIVLRKGENTEINAGVNPDDASDTSLTYSSSDESVITVDSEGNVSAIDKGTATITITSISNPEVTAVITVTVVIDVTNIDAHNVRVNIDETENVDAIVTPDNASDTSVIYESSNPVIATVDANGNVKGINKGTVTITITSVSNPEIVKTVTATIVRPVTSINTTGNIVLFVGSTINMTASANPSNASDTTLIYFSYDNTVATIDASGNITAIGKGTTTITVTSVSNLDVSASITVTVKQSVTGITITNNNISLIAGASEAIMATATPENASDASLSYSSSDTNIATVNAEGVVTAVNKGTATITVSSVSNPRVKATVTVVVTKPITGINAGDFAIVVGESRRVTAQAIPVDASCSGFTYAGNGSAAITLDESGNIQGIAPGTATITITSVDDASITKTITVTVLVARISAVNNNPSLRVGETELLEIISMPDRTPYSNVTYESSDSSVITIDESGNMTAMDNGIAVITVVSKDNPSATVLVTVTVINPVTSITSDEDIILDVGVTRNINAEANPDDATDTRLTYTSSNPSIVSVDANGNIKGIASGTVTIRIASVSNPSITKIVNVRVRVKSSARITVASNMTVGDTSNVIINTVSEPGVTYTVIYKSSDYGVITIGNDGSYSAVKSGSAIIGVTVSFSDGTTVVENKLVTVNNATTPEDPHEGGSFRCKMCDTYEAQKDQPGIGIIIAIVHFIIHTLSQMGILA